MYVIKHLFLILNRNAHEILLLLLQPVLQAEKPVMSGAKPTEGKTSVINTVRKWTPSQVEKWLDNNSLPKYVHPHLLSAFFDSELYTIHVYEKCFLAKKN